ncbi:4-hydroxy-tetrahydrodipicolinate reductase, partial [Alphaproteobacteria bacterium]|nr:4-hydroxy-tetrahydrodipicolinate reductase [Alphaproteobacteria bacterium]
TKLAMRDSEISLCGGIEHTKHKLLGKDIGELAGEIPLNVYVTDEIKSFFNNLDVAIEFGLEQATKKFVKEASKRNVAFVSGSTGLSKETISLFNKCSKKIPIFWAPNMSVGANILSKVANDITPKLAKDFDIDITDIHHKQKRDTPSGTALFIKESIEKALKMRKIKKKINVSAIRAGDSTGEHSVIFSGNSEKIIIKHVATSRNIFANGAIEAAKWISKQKSGFYNMKDFLTSIS